MYTGIRTKCKDASIISVIHQGMVLTPELFISKQKEGSRTQCVS